MRNASSLENTPRVIAVAVAFFGGLAVLGLANGVFESFNRGEIAALALFAAFFAGLVVTLDPGVRALFRRGPARCEPAGKDSNGRPAIG